MKTFSEIVEAQYEVLGSSPSKRVVDNDLDNAANYHEQISSARERKKGKVIFQGKHSTHQKHISMRFSGNEVYV